MIGTLDLALVRVYENANPSQLKCPQLNRPWIKETHEFVLISIRSVRERVIIRRDFVNEGCFFVENEDSYRETQ